jgi:hypothetical protein
VTPHQAEVIGCELDRTNNTISFYRNGEPLGIAFERVKRNVKLFPYVMLEHGQACRFNFGRDRRLDFLRSSKQPEGFAFQVPGTKALHELLPDDAIRRLRRKTRRHNSFVPKSLWDTGAWSVALCSASVTLPMHWAVWFAQESDDRILDLLMGDESRRKQLARDLNSAMEGYTQLPLLSAAAEFGNPSGLRYLLGMKEKLPVKEAESLGLHFQHFTSPRYGSDCVYVIFCFPNYSLLFISVSRPSLSHNTFKLANRKYYYYDQVETNGK